MSPKPLAYLAFKDGALEPVRRPPKAEAFMLTDTKMLMVQERKLRKLSAP